MKTVTERFLKYVSFDTMSDEYSETCPSTDKQKALGAYLVEEMKAMGIADAHMDEFGYVYGTVPGDPRLPTIGLIAHMDTSPDASGADIKAKIVEYTGSDVCLNEQKDIWLRQSDYPSLKNHVGKHLIVTDGTTLLGADDKAGIAEILACAERLLTTKMRHATLKIGFTPDEEIGRGADKFDLKKFGADKFRLLLEGSSNRVEYQLNAIRNKYDLKEDDQKIRYVHECAELICTLHSSIQREVYGGRVAESAGISMDAMKLEVSKAYKRRIYREKKKQEQIDLAPTKALQPKTRSIRYDNMKSARAVGVLTCTCATISHTW